MKIAVPTNDTYTVSGHFGRTKGFKIFEIEDNKIIKSEHRTNDFTGHAHGGSTEHNHEEGQGQGSQNHSHTGIMAALDGCEVVIAGGMGKRLYDDFEKNNIKVFVTKELHIGTAVELFLKDQLDNNSDGCCTH